MNPLKTIKGTLISGFVVALVIAMFMRWGLGTLSAWSVIVWLHVLAGITWIGLLYYFNFVQVPALAEAAADKEGPGGGGVTKYVAPRALLWFRWAALATWITGALALVYVGGFFNHFFALNGVTVIGVGAWLGTIMLLNVWGLIWPNQKKILGLVEASAEQVAKARVVAAMASRTNTLLSIPMIMCMVGYGHGLTF